jgi:hypothetical protein
VKKQKIIFFSRLIPILAFILILLASLPPYTEQISKRSNLWRGQPMNPLSPHALSPLIIRVELRKEALTVDLQRTYIDPTHIHASVKINITHPDGTTNIVIVKKVLPLGTTQRLEIPLQSATKPCIAIDVSLDNEASQKWTNC